MSENQGENYIVRAYVAVTGDEGIWLSGVSGVSSADGWLTTNDGEMLPPSQWELDRQRAERLTERHATECGIRTLLPLTRCFY